MDTSRGRGLPQAVTLLAAAVTAIPGFWALLAPESFARVAGYPFHEHFERDLGAFQIGVAVTLLLALLWADTLATGLAGFLVLNTIHAVNHAGTPSQAWAFAALSIAVAVALAVRLRQLGLVVGRVGVATSPELVPFLRQKTIALTSYRADGTPVSTPVSIAVDGDRAYVRSFEKAFKTRRVRNNPQVEFAPSDARGAATGPARHGRLDRVDGEEYRHAARLLARKHPLLHGVLVPLAHRLMRSRTGATVHFVLTPATRATERSARQ